MDWMKELQQRMLPVETAAPPAAGSGGVLIVVLKAFRFHKALSIELYEAATTAGGKIKNPLLPVSAPDAALATRDPDALLFYTSASRFAHPPAGPRSAADLRALKILVKNPLRLRFFLHNRDFSENVTAGSLTEVQAGPVLNKLSLLIHRGDGGYRVTPQLAAGAQTVHPVEGRLLHDYFFLHGGILYLAGNFALLRLLHFFSDRRHLQVPEAQFKAFEETILRPLEGGVEVVHTYIEAATEEEVEEAGLKGATERLIYLSDLHPYVLINPVVRYGSVELPLRSHKAVYLPDVRGRLMALPRNEKEEGAFLTLLLQQHPHFYEQLEDDLPYFYLHRDRFLDEDWFLEAFEQWRAAGISIFGFQGLRGNKRNGHRAAISVHVESGLNWFNTKLKVTYGHAMAPLKALQKAVRQGSRYVALDDGTLGLLPQEWIGRMQGFFHAAEIVGEDLITSNARFDTVASLYKEEELDSEVSHRLHTLREGLSHPEALAPPAAPLGLQAKLLPYQLQGLAWLRFLDRHGLGGVLADEMGLGKTVQAIAFFLFLKEEGSKETHLLVVPTSLLFNWAAELARFAPSLRVLTLHGAGRARGASAFEGYDIVLTTYGTLLSDIGYLRRHPFGYAVLDEAQSIKNPGSQRYAAARLLRARNRLALTGTPIENGTFDLYALISFILPGLLGDQRFFREVYATPIDKFEDRRRAAELQRKVAPFILRRTRTEVAAELPPKTETVQYCPMGQEQRAVYDTYEAELRDYLEGKMKDEILRSSIHVLRGLTRLRLICNDHRLVGAEGSEASAKIRALMEGIEQHAGAHKILVFSQFVSMLGLIREELDRSGVRYALLTGDTQDREGVVDRFQDDPSVRVFLISLKAGGTGLNLTAASLVYLVDPWWNPAVEAQAIDRTYRIGQRRAVQAVRLICPGTVEDKMRLLQQDKKERFEGLIRSGQSPFSAMTAEDWKALFRKDP